ncbi:MAG: hypothetical protein HQL12_03085 [Candidatus Omnitrophica bacterium]|nr:hypothetical protein [Candidatus Omnitrophota bacterium]
MHKVIFIIAILILSANTASFADQAEQVITLKDGSQIKGTLAGIDNGIYTVKTPIIGDVHVAAGDVASITNGNVPVAAPSTNNAAFPGQSSDVTSNMDQQVAANQQRLMANPQAMADLQQIAQDPEIMQALSDPAVVQAVTSHDYQAVKNNPKIQALMTNPKMQALLQKLAAGQQQ